MASSASARCDQRVILFAYIGPLHLVLSIYLYVLIARALLSWIPNMPSGLRPIADFLHVVTEPYLRLFRPLVSPVRVGGLALDVSFMVAIFVLLLLLVAV